MLGRKSTDKSGALSARVQRIAAAPPVVPKELADAGTGKRDVRKPSFRPGTLTFMHGERVDVMVTNLSAAGARVRFVRRGLLPERVQLVEPMSGISKWGYVAWQSASEAGLRFVGASSKAAS